MAMARSKPPKSSATRRKARKLLAVLGLIAGIGLLTLERTEALGGDRQGASWFWIVVAMLLILLALAELFDRTPADPEGEER